MANDIYNVANGNTGTQKMGNAVVLVCGKSGKYKVMDDRQLPDDGSATTPVNIANIKAKWDTRFDDPDPSQG